MKENRVIKFIVNPIVIIIIAVINLTPFVWAILTSIKSNQDIYAFPIRITNFKPTLEHYQRVFGGKSFPVAMGTSLYYGFAAILGCLVIGSLAAYGFARYRNKITSMLFYFVLFGIPLANGSTALIISNYLIFAKLGIVNKAYTMPLIYTAYFLPMIIVVLLAGVRSIPYEIEESAIIDGCRKSYIIFRLIPTLNRPAMACAALFVFIRSWNEFLLSAVLTVSSKLRSIQVATYYFMGYYGIEWGPLMAATVCSLIPIFILFAFAGKQLVSGLTSGAVKG